MYGLVPPNGFAVTVPSQFPLQLASFFVDVAVNAFGALILKFTILVHPFASVTVILIAPTHNPETEEVVCPLLHKKV